MDQNSPSRPDREPLLSDIFNIVKAKGPVSVKGISKRLPKDHHYSEPEIHIALCMLEGRGLVEQFGVASGKVIEKNRSHSLIFYYKAVVEQPQELPIDEPPKEKPVKRKTCWQRFCDFILE